MSHPSCWREAAVPAGCGAAPACPLLPLARGSTAAALIPLDCCPAKLPELYFAESLRCAVITRGCFPCTAQCLRASLDARKTDLPLLPGCEVPSCVQPAQQWRVGLDVHAAPWIPECRGVSPAQAQIWGQGSTRCSCGNTGPLFTFSFPALWWKITLRAPGWCCGPGNVLAGGCPSQLTVSWLLPWRLSASTSCRLGPRGRHRPAAACLFVSYKTAQKGLTCAQSRSGPEACWPGWRSSLVLLLSLLCPTPRSSLSGFSAPAQGGELFLCRSTHIACLALQSLLGLWPRKPCSGECLSQLQILPCSVEPQAMWVRTFPVLPLFCRALLSVVLCYCLLFFFLQLFFFFFNICIILLSLAITAGKTWIWFLFLCNSGDTFPITSVAVGTVTF